MGIDGLKTMSKTQHYRKVTKPLLERKRRARMNHYLDELKDLIVETMGTRGEQVAKLEKADILELTVTYLKDKHEQQWKYTPGGSPFNVEKFRAGYTQAAYEVSKVFATMPGIDVQFGTKLMKHLGYKLKELNIPDPTTTKCTTTDHNSPTILTPPPSPTPELKTTRNSVESTKDVWRPW